MLLKLSEKEILLLKVVCYNTSNAGAIANLMGVKKSFASRLLKSLEEKKLVSIEPRGVQKLVSLSLASHAQAFRQVVDLRGYKAGIESWLAGSALDILVIAGFGEGATLSLLEKECSCSKPTIYRTAKKLKSAGAVTQREARLLVSDHGVENFANYFADNIQRKLLEGVGGASIRVRKHCVVRTGVKKIPEFFTATGLNALREKGLKFISTSYSDYYFNLDGVKRSVNVEEAFIHALLSTTIQQNQDLPLLAKFLKEYGKKLDLRKLLKLAEQYAVSEELAQLRNAVSYYEKLGGLE